MDRLMNAGRDFLEDRDDRDDRRQQGDNSNYAPSGNNRPAGGLSSFLGGLDFDDATETANRHAGDSGDRDLFGSILSSVSQKQHKLSNEDVDEDDYVQQHRKTYNDEDDNADENSLGPAAAMQALKMFNSGESKGNSQSAFLGMAMSEASKLFDAKSSSDKLSSGTSKNAVVQKAAEAAMKMYFKSQGGQQGGLAGLAAKFM